jgi:hypothetical protein
MISKRTGHHSANAVAGKSKNGLLLGVAPHCLFRPVGFHPHKMRNGSLRILREFDGRLA